MAIWRLRTDPCKCRTRLSKLFNLCRHVRIAADPVGRIFARQNPDIVIRLGELRVTQSPLWLVADKSLNADLGRNRVLRCSFGSRHDRIAKLICERRAGEDNRK